MSKVRIERAGRNALARLIGALAPVKTVSPEEFRADWSAGRIRKILLVRPHQGLGDLLLATPILRALKTARPETELHFLADTYNSVVIRQNRRLSRVWIWNKRAAYRPDYLVSFIRQLRREKYDLALIISSHTPSFTSFLLARASGARRVLGFETEAHYDGAVWSRYLAHLDIPNPDPAIPESEKYLELLKPFGLTASIEPEFHCSATDQSWANTRWQTFLFPTDRPVVGLFLGGNPQRIDRLWPAANWAELARRLLASGRTVIAILPPEGQRSGSGQHEPGIYQDVCARLGQRLPVFRDGPLARDAAFLAHLDLFVCPDGGLMHVAVATRAPTLGLFIQTPPQRWLPSVAWASACTSADQTPAGLSVDSVYGEVERRLAARRQAVAS